MSKDKKYTYKIVEENDDSFQTKIVKKGVEVEFNMREMENFTTAALGKLDEFRGQLNLEDAKIKNVEENHADAVALVSELDPIKQNAILIWLNSKRLVDTIAPQRDELEKALEEHKVELEEIIKQTGWEPTQNEPEETSTEEAG